jgi:hypothetical protein
MPKLLNNDSTASFKPLKLVKHVAIAHSGIYTYGKRELFTLGLDSEVIPEEFKDLEHFNVYRPAVLFAGTADLFTNLPVTVEHPDCMVDEYNCRDLMKGFTGNDSEVIMEDGEAYVHSTVTLIDKDALEYYENNHREVSPGYISHCIWESGEHNGVPYQIKMVGIDDVNHLALTVRGRGGKTACVRDSARTLNILEWAKLTMDSENIRDMISKVATDSSFIAPIIKSIEDIPDTNSKALFTACLDDMNNASTMEPTVIEKAVDKLLQIYDNLISENCSTYNIGGNMPTDETKPTEDYAAGATGLAGTGTQTPEEKAAEAAEKPVEVKDETTDTPTADKPAETPVEGKSEEPSGERKEEHMSKEETLFAEILSELKAIRTALADKGVSDACSDKPTEDKSEDGDKPTEDSKVTTDSALVEDSDTNTGISVEDFMADMRR